MAVACSNPLISACAVGKPELQWFALHVRSNCEKVVSCSLRSKGIDEFSPVYRKVSRWSDRKKTIELPLFPGYVFAAFAIDNRLPVLATPGVIQIVGCGRVPEPVSADELAAIQALANSGESPVPWPYLRTGDCVEVVRGSLAGLRGILLQTKRVYRLVVSLTLLQRSVAVEIDRDFIQPYENHLEPGSGYRRSSNAAGVSFPVAIE